MFHGQEKLMIEEFIDVIWNWCHTKRAAIKAALKIL